VFLWFLHSCSLYNWPLGCWVSTQINENWIVIMALQDFIGPLAAFSVPWSYTQSVWLLDGGSARRKASTYTQNNKHTCRINAHRHTWLEWDSNSRSQCSSERRQLMTYTALLLWSALSLNNVPYTYFVVRWPVLSPHIRQRVSQKIKTIDYSGESPSIWSAMTRPSFLLGEG
jgi:hypothetical protein